MNKEGFLFEVQRLFFEMESLIDKYGLRGEVVNLLVTGLIEKSPEGVSKLKALFSYSIEDAEELDEIIDFIYNTWDYQIEEEEDDNNDEPDVSGLLDGLGIDLE